MTIRRTITNRWYLEIRAYGPNRIRNQFETRISIAKCTSNENAQNKPFTPRFTYQGNISSYSDSTATIMNEGNYLCLNDEQIKPLLEADKLFKLKVEFIRKNNETKQNETITGETMKLQDNSA